MFAARPLVRSVARRSPLSLRLASHIPPRQPFTKLTPASLSSLVKLVGSPSQIQSTIAADGLTTVESEELDAYNEDWMGKYKGQSGVVVKPKTAQEVGDIVSSLQPLLPLGPFAVVAPSSSYNTVASSERGHVERAGSLACV